MKVRLRTFEDEVTGNLGFKVWGADHESLFADTEGIGIAHDILEHQNGPGRIGDILDEMEALGGLWWVRGQTGRLSKRDSIFGTEQVLGMELERMYEDSLSQLDYDSLHILAPRTHQSDADYDFEAAIQYSKDLLRSTSGSNHIVDEERRAEMLARLDDYHTIALARMRIGWRKAKRRFPDSYEVNQMFWSIQEAVEAAARLVEMEGQEFMLTAGRDGDSYVREVYA